MRNRMLVPWLGCCLAAVLVSSGCGGEAATGAPAGSLSLDLDLAGSAQIDEVWYNITGNEMEPMSGLIDTSAPGATASVEVFGIPPGTGYLVELRAIVDDGTSCSGSAPFDVMAGIATPVAVMINCKPEQRFGSVRVNGKLNVCAELMKAVVAPLRTSVGSTIDLSAQGFDAEGDPVSYLWGASRGSIGSPGSKDTQYLCTLAGRHYIRIEVSDDDFTDCVDAWDVEVQCDGDGGGTGGAGGSGGTGGSGASGGTGGTPSQCIPANVRCQNASIDPIVEDPTCMLSEPPDLPEACTGLESTTNPATCTPTGVQSLHQVQQLAVAPDCNSGFDLDQCDGNSCVRGGLAPGEGMDGVDNALTGLAPVLAGVGGNLVGIDQALYDGLCDDSIDWALLLDPNPGENCLTVTPVYGGVPAEPIAMNLSDTGCISGTLGTLPISIAGVAGELENAVIRGSADTARGLDVVLGATVADETAAAIAEALIAGGSAVVAQVLDINSDLESDLSSACDALSLSLDMGAKLVGGSTEGACTDAANATVYANLTYVDDDGNVFTGTDAAAAMGSDCIFGTTQSTPLLPGCGDEAFSVISCFPNCPSQVINDLADCVATCTQGGTAEASPPGLSNECIACTGYTVACGAAFCTAQCVADTNAPVCISCRCDNDCLPAFDRCSGLPPSGDCN